MANELWRVGLLTILLAVIYWQVWHRRSPTANKRYLLISLIGFLMFYVLFTGSLLPVPLIPLVLVTSITGAVLAVVFMRKFHKS